MRTPLTLGLLISERPGDRRHSADLGLSVELASWLVFGLQDVPSKLTGILTMLIRVPRDDYDLAVDARAHFRTSLTPADAGLMLHIVCAFIFGEDVHPSRLQDARRIFANVRCPIAVERSHEAA